MKGQNRNALNEQTKNKRIRKSLILRTNLLNSRMVSFWQPLVKLNINYTVNTQQNRLPFIIPIMLLSWHIQQVGWSFKHPFTAIIRNANALSRQWPIECHICNFTYICLTILLQIISMVILFTLIHIITYFQLLYFFIVFFNYYFHLFLDTVQVAGHAICNSLVFLNTFFPSSIQCLVNIHLLFSKYV